MGSVDEEFRVYVSEASSYAEAASHTEGGAGDRMAAVAQVYATLALAVATHGEEKTPGVERL